MAPTRREVMALLLKEGPLTASALGDKLGLSAAGVRRHLDILIEEGSAEGIDRRVGRAGRGRPAKHFRLTDHGRSQFGHAYDDLAAQALDALRDVGGSEAVKHFARHRINQIVAEVSDSLEQETDQQAKASALAAALDEHGYAATVTQAGQGVQICQHHCPVAHVAAAHPELCEVEQEVFSALLGTHVQPLATIAEGHGICTTNIPLTPITHSTPPKSPPNDHRAAAVKDN